jgi:hypothetical protein
MVQHLHPVVSIQSYRRALAALAAICSDPDEFLCEPGREIDFRNYCVDAKFDTVVVCENLALRFLVMLCKSA